MARRFLLDQNFPKPKLDVHALDANVTYQHVDTFAPELVAVSTPDWIIYLAAEKGGFDGIVTRDAAQTQQVEELVALSKTHLTVVTWRSRVEDPVTEWGQLLAYMPQVLKQMVTPAPRIVVLPAPRLERGSVLLPSPMIHTEASRQKVSFQELQAGTLKSLRQELARSHRWKPYANLLDD